MLVNMNPIAKLVCVNCLTFTFSDNGISFKTNDMANAYTYCLSQNTHFDLHIYIYIKNLITSSQKKICFRFIISKI